MTDTKYDGGGGVYLNMLDAHPPFQIDGNFGATSGMCEMLVQSHLKAGDGSVLVDLLPALPTSWPSGKITGLRVRGGATIDLEWTDGKLKTCRVHSEGEQPLTLKYGELETKYSGSDSILYDGKLEKLIGE